MSESVLARMSQAQRVAIVNYVRLAAETVHPKFRTMMHDGLTLIVTVNAGYE